MSTYTSHSNQLPSPTAVFSLFTGGPKQLLTKRIILKEDGTLDKTVGNAGSGYVETIELKFHDFPEFLSSCQKNQCLIHGTVKNRLADYGQIEVTTTANHRTGTINRTLEYFEHPDSPCLSMLDYDPGPGEPLNPDQLIKIIDKEVFPGFANAASVAALSTSAKIYGPDDNLLSSAAPSFHLYFIARDGRDLPRFGKLLFKRLWLAGYGYGKLSKSGSFLIRGPVDASVFSPERCDFVAGAELGAGLTQRRPEPSFHPGGYLNTSLLPDLTEAEEAEYQRLVAVEHDRLKPQQEPMRRAYAASESNRTGEASESVYKRLVEAENGTIDADTVLTVKDTGGKRMTIRAMVKAEMHLSYVEDPTEQCDTCARLYIDGINRTAVRSFLHGGTNLTVQGLTNNECALSIRGVKSADIGDRNYKDSLGIAEQLGGAPSVIKAIINKFAKNVPSKYSAIDFIRSISSTAPNIDGIEEHIAWITSKHREEAISLTSISIAMRKKHGYQKIGICHYSGTPQKAGIYGLWPLPVKPLDGVVIFKAPHGSGKTQLVGMKFAKYAKELGETFVGTCHRISLTHELAKRLKVDNYQDVTGIKNGLAVCVNSIIADGQSEYCLRVDNLFIDEFSQVLRHVADGSVKDFDRIKVYEALKKMITNAKRLIVADADLGDREIEFLEMCRPGERFRIFESAADNSHLSVTYQHGSRAAQLAYGSILADLDAGSKVIVATDSKKKSATLTALIASELPKKRVLNINADTVGGEEQQAFIRNPNAVCVEYDITIHSPSISSGVSIEVPHFDRGYGLFFGVIAPSDAIQMIRRSRTLTEWHLAFDSNNLNDSTDATNIIEGMEQAATNTATEFDVFRANSVAWLNKGCNHFARNMLYLLESSGFQLNLLPDNETDYADDAIKEAKGEAYNQRINAILEAEDLERDDLEKIKRNQNATYAEKMAVRRAYIRNALKLPNLTVGDIEFFDEGRGLAKLERFELAANIKKSLTEDEDQNLSLRRNNAVKVKSYKRILGPLGINLMTGEGSYGVEEAAAVVDMVMEQKTLLSYLKIVPNSVNYNCPEDTIKFVGRILELMGLKTRARQKQKGGIRKRYYSIKPDGFGSIRERAVRRRIAAELPPVVSTKDRWGSAHFRQTSIQEIDEVCTSELRRLGVYSPPEDGGYNHPEPPWQGPFHHLFTCQL